MTIRIITTGGTIDKIYFDQLSAFHVGDPQIVEVLRAAGVTFQYEVTELLRKDSLELTDDDRRLIRDTIAASPCEHVVVTHGTDTMVQTAKVLHDIPGKTIVLTGAMQPAKFHLTDAVFNIATAITAVQLLPPGVYIAMNGRIFDPNHVRKNRTKGCFESADDAPVRTRGGKPE